jgi:hypothetical protein
VDAAFDTRGVDTRLLADLLVAGVLLSCAWIWRDAGDPPRAVPALGAALAVALLLRVLATGPAWPGLVLALSAACLAHLLDALRRARP